MLVPPPDCDRRRRANLNKLQFWQVHILIATFLRTVPHIGNLDRICTATTCQPRTHEPFFELSSWVPAFLIENLLSIQKLARFLVRRKAFSEEGRKPGINAEFALVSSILDLSADQVLSGAKLDNCLDIQNHAPMNPAYVTTQQGHSVLSRTPSDRGRG